MDPRRHTAFDDWLHQFRNKQRSSNLRRASLRKRKPLPTPCVKACFVAIRHYPLIVQVAKKHQYQQWQKPRWKPIRTGLLCKIPMMSIIYSSALLKKKFGAYFEAQSEGAASGRRHSPHPTFCSSRFAYKNLFRFGAKN